MRTDQILTSGFLHLRSGQPALKAVADGVSCQYQVCMLVTLTIRNFGAINVAW